MTPSRMALRRTALLPIGLVLAVASLIAVPLAGAAAQRTLGYQAMHEAHSAAASTQTPAQVLADDQNALKQSVATLETGPRLPVNAGVQLAQDTLAQIGAASTATSSNAGVIPADLAGQALTALSAAAAAITPMSTVAGLTQLETGLGSLSCATQPAAAPDPLTGLTGLTGRPTRDVIQGLNDATASIDPGLDPIISSASATSVSNGSSSIGIGAPTGTSTVTLPCNVLSGVGPAATPVSSPAPAASVSPANCYNNATGFPVKATTRKYGDTAKGFAESHCDLVPDIIVRVSKTCLASRDGLAFPSPPFTTRRCSVQDYAGFASRINQVETACRGYRDWQTRQDLTVFDNGKRKGTIRSGSLITTLTCK